MQTIKLAVLLVFFLGCSSEQRVVNRDDQGLVDLDEVVEVNTTQPWNYLALGDSYTSGEAVKKELSFPYLLMKCVEARFKKEIRLERIAETGWTTQDLLKNMELGLERSNYDFCTLLIGVNNQFRGLPLNTYERDFGVLVGKALALVGEKAQNLVVISIPDYAYTPRGIRSNPSMISKEIDAYNEVAERIATTKGVRFMSITDITRQGLDEPSLVAVDELHLSGLAYERFVARICPLLIDVLNKD